MRHEAMVVRAMWTTMRPYLLFVSAITGVVGMSATKTISPAPLIITFVASFFAYGFGQALTDCFQTDTDAISAPYRPLAAGLVSRNSILVMSLVGMSLCAVGFAVGNPWNFALGTLAAIGLATYTPFKRRWWGGPWYNSWIVVLLCVMGYLAANEHPNVPIPQYFLPLLGMVFFGYANFVLAGYFKDIDADAATGYNTLPVVFGRRLSAIASDGLAIAFVVAATWTMAIALQGLNPRPGHALGLIFAMPALWHILIGQLQLHRNSIDAEAYRPIAHVVQSYVLLLSAVATVLRPEWFGLLVVHYAAFHMVLRWRPEVTQI